MDEVAITNLGSFDSKKFVDVSKEDLELGTQSDEVSTHWYICFIYFRA